jgi:hypothetical protein
MWKWANNLQKLVLSTACAEVRLEALQKVQRKYQKGFSLHFQSPSLAVRISGDYFFI